MLVHIVEIFLASNCGSQVSTRLYSRKKGIGTLAVGEIKSQTGKLDIKVVTGLVMINYLEHRRTINDAYCAGKLRWLRQEIAQKSEES